MMALLNKIVQQEVMVNSTQLEKDPFLRLIYFDQILAANVFFLFSIRPIVHFGLTFCQQIVDLLVDECCVGPLRPSILGGSSSNNQLGLASRAVRNKA